MRIMRAIKMNIEQIKETITIVKDYPIKGIVFKDITLSLIHISEPTRPY